MQEEMSMRRKVYHKQGSEIDNALIKHIASIGRQAFSPNIEKWKKTRTGSINTDDETHVVSGKDWYMIYECPNSREIYIAELARIDAVSGEGAQQLREIVTALRELVETDKIITADLKEDTSYPLFLISKKRGLIQQVGNDEMYYYNYDFLPRMVVSEKKQEQLYKKLVKRRKPSKQARMHYVSFAKDR